MGVLDLAGQQEPCTVLLVSALFDLGEGCDLLEPCPVKAIAATNHMYALDRGLPGKVLYGHVLADAHGKTAVDVEVGVYLHGPVMYLRLLNSNGEKVDRIPER